MNVAARMMLRLTVVIAILTVVVIVMPGYGWSAAGLPLALFVAASIAVLGGALTWVLAAI
jgi:hypothetical protein